MIRPRRRLAAFARRVGLRRLAARLNSNPGPRIRIWTADWKLLADTDRGDTIPPVTASLSR